MLGEVENAGSTSNMFGASGRVRAQVLARLRRDPRLAIALDWLIEQGVLEIKETGRGSNFQPGIYFRPRGRARWKKLLKS